MFSLTRTCRFPLLMFITMRGEWEEFNPWQVPMGSIVDPVLKLCEVEISRARAPGDVAGNAERAIRDERIAAVILSQELIGKKDQVGSNAAQRWPHCSPDAATICWSYRASARRPGMLLRPATTIAISISGALWGSRHDRIGARARAA